MKSWLTRLLCRLVYVCVIVMASPGGLFAMGTHGDPPDVEDLSVINDALFPTEDDLWAGLLEMTDLGPRLTGSPAHKEMLDRLEVRLKALGFDTYRDTIAFKRWEATSYGITIHYPDGRDVSVPVASYWPRSGETSPEGITAPLSSFIYYNNIVLDDLDMNYLLSIYAPGIYLQKYALRNAKAVILIRDEDYEEIKGDYTPFNGGFLETPTLMVDKKTGDVLRDALSQNASVTLTLDADIIDDTTDHLYGFLHGQSPDIIMMGIHSDGQNALEENGVPSLMAIATYFSRIPEQDRPKTLGVLFATGHMAPRSLHEELHMETGGWCDLHPDIAENIVAAVAPEHFAAMKAAMDENGQYTSTGEPYIYKTTPSTAALSDICEEFAEGNHNMECSVIDIWPFKYFMVGSAMGWMKNNIPVMGGMCLSGLAGPDYMVNMDTGGPDKIDKQLYWEQTRVYAQIVGRLLSMSRDDL